MISEEAFDHFQIISTDRITLRAPQMNDVSFIKKVRTNPDVLEFLDNDAFIDLEQAEHFLKNAIEGFKQKNSIYWIIELNETKKAIGDFSFWRLDKKNARGEIGYTLLPEYWGKGIMKEVIKAAVSYGFKELRLHSIEANINPLNIRSAELLKKVGFRKEAYFRENYFYNGKFLDSEIYCLLEKDL